MKHHSPDVAVMLGVREKRDNWTSFIVAEQGVRPNLIVEIVSPNYRVNDVVTKVDHYYRAGVAWYVIVDRETEDDAPELIVRRHRPDGWEFVPANEQGRIWLPCVRVWLGIHDGRVACFDGETGEMFGDYSTVCRELAAKEALIEALESQMEVEIDKRQEIQVLAKAETKRADLEAKRANAAVDRADSEAKRADVAAEAYRLLEEKFAAVEAELARSRGGA